MARAPSFNSTLSGVGFLNNFAVNIVYFQLFLPVFIPGNGLSLFLTIDVMYLQFQLPIFMPTKGFPLFLSININLL